MSKNKIFWLFVVIVVVSILVAYFNFNNKASKIESLKVGVIFPATGDAASYGQSLKEGIIVADSILKDSVNLDIIFEDSKAEPKTAVSAIEKLINQDKVDLLIGDMFTNTTLAISPIAEKNNILLLSPTGSANEISLNKKNIFRIYPSEIEEATTLSNFYKANFPNSNCAILCTNEDAMKNVKNTIIENIGVSNISTQIEFSKGQTDFKNLIDKIPSTTTNVFLLGYLNDIALIVKQSKQLNKKFVFISMSTVYDNQFLELTKNASDGLYLTAPAFSTTSANSLSKVFTDKYRTIYKKEPNVWAGYGFDALYILYKGWAKSKKESIPINKSMIGLNFDGVTGNLIIKPDHSIDKNFNLMQVVNNNFKPIN